MDASQEHVARYLVGRTFPASRGDVADHAAKEGADAGVVDGLRALPDRSFASLEEALAALGEYESPLPETMDEAGGERDESLQGTSPAAGRAIGGGSARGGGA